MLPSTAEPFNFRMGSIFFIWSTGKYSGNIYIYMSHL
jgi:hypothetical protein